MQAQAPPQEGLREHLEKAARRSRLRTASEAWLGWSAKQGRIVSGGGPHVAERLYTEENGYAFDETELPHHHLLAGTSRETYLCWREEHATPAPNWLCGTWGRTLFTGGWEHTTDETETCYNLQTPSLFVDMRIPTERGRVFGGRRWGAEPLRELDALELRLLARQHTVHAAFAAFLGRRQHAFGGYARFEREAVGAAAAGADSSAGGTDLSRGGISVEGSAGGRAARGEPSSTLVCTRHHAVDWNFVRAPRSRPNKWRVDPVLDCPRAFHTWKEWSYAADAEGTPYYMEQWVRRDAACSERHARADGADADSVFALHGALAAGAPPGPPRPVIVVAVADRFSYVVGREWAALSGDAAALLAGWRGSLVDLVDAALDAGHRELAEAALSLEAGHGSISNGWAIEASVQPWREGGSLHDVLGHRPQLHARVGSELPARAGVRWGAAELDVIECTSSAALGAALG